MSVVFNLTTLNWLYIMLILIQLMKMQFNKILKECYYFSNSDWFFEQKFAFNLLCLINKMVHFSSLTNSVKWYTLIHYFTNKHLLDFTWGKVALLYNYLHIFKLWNTFDAKHVATMYKSTQNIVEPNFQMFIKDFLIYTFLHTGQTKTKFSVRKQLIVLHNKKKQEISFMW